MDHGAWSTQTGGQVLPGAREALHCRALLATRPGLSIAGAVILHLAEPQVLQNMLVKLDIGLSFSLQELRQGDVVVVHQEAWRWPTVGLAACLASHLGGHHRWAHRHHHHTSTASLELQCMGDSPTVCRSLDVIECRMQSTGANLTLTRHYPIHSSVSTKFIEV